MSSKLNKANEQKSQQPKQSVINKKNRQISVAYDHQQEPSEYLSQPYKQQQKQQNNNKSIIMRNRSLPQLEQHQNRNADVSVITQESNANDLRNEIIESLEVSNQKLQNFISNLESHLSDFESLQSFFAQSEQNQNMKPLSEKLAELTTELEQANKDKVDMKKDSVMMKQFLQNSDKVETTIETENKVKELQMEIKYLKNQVKSIQRGNGDQEKVLNRINTKLNYDKKFQQMKETIKGYKQKYKELAGEFGNMDHQEIQQHSNFVGKIIKQQQLKENVMKLKQSPTRDQLILNSSPVQQKSQLITPINEIQEGTSNLHRIQEVLERKKQYLQLSTEKQTVTYQQIYQTQEEQTQVLQSLLQETTQENQKLQAELQKLRQLAPESIVSNLDLKFDPKLPRVANLQIQQSMKIQTSIDRKMNQIDFKIGHLTSSNKRNNYYNLGGNDTVNIYKSQQHKKDQTIELLRLKGKILSKKIQIEDDKKPYSQKDIQTLNADHPDTQESDNTYRQNTNDQKQLSEDQKFIETEQ